MRPGRREAFQMHSRRFVGAVLAPHHAENSQLSEIRIASQYFLRTRVFARSQTVFGGDLGSDFNLGIDHFWFGTRKS
jgi:hypothetical protein